MEPQQVLLLAQWLQQTSIHAHSCQSGTWKSVSGGGSCPTGSTLISSIQLCVDSMGVKFDVTFIAAGEYCANKGLKIPSMGQLDSMNSIQASIPGWVGGQLWIDALPAPTQGMVSCNLPNYCGMSIYTSAGNSVFCVK
ncbi:MAG: hypothetical protein M1300_07485 [Epsilonproteobacteria bacterium]|nr:hypothetical protein [Campylobacterota bacterium]